jgi:hypothetical protein
MSAKTKFEQEFYEEEFEILALLKDDVGGGAIIDDMLKPSVHTLAMVDLHTNTLSKEEGRIEWMIPNSEDRDGWGYDFKQFEIYHMRVRKCIPMELQPYQSKSMNNRYMIVEVMDDIISNSELEDLQEYYRKPVVIEHKLGTFTLEREYSWFEGIIDWMGEEANVYLCMDEDGNDTANDAIARLEKLIEDVKGNDFKFREFAAKKLTDLANDWLEESDEEEHEEITEQEFAKRIYISEISIEDDGMTIFFYDDDMFWGHIIMIYVDENGELKSANIAG